MPKKTSLKNFTWRFETAFFITNLQTKMKKFYSIMMGMLLTISSFAALPSKVYAPYVDVMLWPTFNLMNCYNATGQKYYTLAFITAGGNGQPTWGGVTAMDQNFMLDQINQIRGVGGDVIISFGGANGTPIDAAITDVNTLVSTYQSVINRYGLTWIDFDIEGFWVADQASIDRRNQAARILQQNNPGLRITYCLPVMPTGLTGDGVNVINKAKAAGVSIYGVNVMAMDYGQNNSSMGQAAISAAQNARNQTGLNIGITPMIGKNDTQNETFTLANATEVLNFANANAYVNMIAMWSANRDNGGCAGQTSASPTCSGLSQSTFQFVNTWKSFSGTSGCTPTAINPYLSVNGGAWQNTGNATLNAGGSFTVGPQPLTGGTWSWTGPGGFTSSVREFTRSNVTTAMGGQYVARHTNSCGAQTTYTFNITINGVGGVTTVYQDCNYGGTAVSLAVGDYDLSAMTSRGVGNDWISSLRVTSGYKVTLYENAGFAGASLVVTADNSCLVGAGWNDRASSMRVATNTTTWSTKIEAESWISMAGVQTEACTEGTLNVGWIDAGDWMAYNVTIPTAGTYRVIYRVASPNAGKTLRLEKDAGATQLGSVTIPNTGNWQGWTNVAHNVTLPAGTYSIGIATATGGFNINYFTITNNLSARMPTMAEEMDSEGNTFVLSPNPVKDVVFIKDFEKVKQVRIFNIQGQEMISVQKPGASISVQSLKTGLHIAVIERLDNSVKQEKLMKE
jgi:hypothetical protein